jgi:hypothetical protein
MPATATAPIASAILSLGWTWGIVILPDRCVLHGHHVAALLSGRAGFVVSPGPHNASGQRIPIPDAMGVL